MKRILRRTAALLLTLALLFTSAPTVHAARIPTSNREIRYGTIRAFIAGVNELDSYQAARDDENGIVYIHARDFATLVGAELSISGKHSPEVKHDDWYFSYTVGGWNVRVSTKTGTGNVSYDFDPNEGDDVGSALYDEFELTDCLYDEASDSWYFPFEEMMYMMALQWECQDGNVIIYRPETLFDVMADYGDMVELTPTYADLMGEEGDERWGYAATYGFGAIIDEMDMSFIWYGAASGFYDLFGHQLFSKYEKETMQSAIVKLQSDSPESGDAYADGMDWVSDFIGGAATALDLSDSGIGFDVAQQLLADMLHISVTPELMDSLSKYATVGAPLLAYALGVGQTMWVRSSITDDLDERLAYIETVTGERAEDSDFWAMTNEQATEAREKYCGDVLNAYSGLSWDDIATMSDGILTIALGDNWKSDLTTAGANAVQNIAPEVMDDFVAKFGTGVSAALTALNWMNLTVGTMDLCVEVAKTQSPALAEALKLSEDASLCRCLIELCEMLWEESAASIRDLTACDGFNQELLDEIRMGIHLMMASSLHAHDMLHNLGEYTDPTGNFQEIGYIARLVESSKHDDLLHMSSSFSDIESGIPGCIRMDIPVEYVRIIEPVIVTTESMSVESDHFYAKITRPRVYSEANPNLTYAVDAVLEERYSDSISRISEAQANAAQCNWDMQTHTITAQLKSAYSNGGFLALSVGYGSFVCSIGHDIYSTESYVFDVASGAILNLPDLWDTKNNPNAESDFIAVLDAAMTATGTRYGASHEPSPVSAWDLYYEAMGKNSHYNDRKYVHWDLDPNGIYFSIEALNMNLMIHGLLIPYEDLEGILKEEYLPPEYAGSAEITVEPFLEEMREHPAFYECTPPVAAVKVSGLATNLWIDHNSGALPDIIDSRTTYFYAFGLQNAIVAMPEPLYGGYDYAFLWQDADGDHFEGAPVP